MSFMKCKILSENTIRQINDLPSMKECYKLVNGIASLLMDEFKSLMTLNDLMPNKSQKFTILNEICTIDSKNNRVLYKSTAINNLGLSNITIGFKSLNTITPASTKAILLSNNTYKIIVDLNILKYYPILYIDDIKNILNCKDDFIHEFTHVYQLIVEKLSMEDEGSFDSDTDEDKFIKQHNLEHEQKAWANQLTSYIEDKHKEKEISNEVFNTLITSKTSDNFFNTLFDVLPDKNKFRIHYNYLTPENRQYWYEVVVELLKDNNSLTESSLKELVAKFKPLHDWLSKNANLILPVDQAPKLYILKLPEEADAITPKELNNWLRENKPFLFKD